MPWPVLTAMLALLAVCTAVAYALDAWSVLFTEAIGLSMTWLTATLPVTFVAVLIHVAAGLAARKHTP